MTPTNEQLPAWFNLAWPDDGDTLSCWGCPHGGTGKTCGIIPWPCLVARAEIKALILRAPRVDALVDQASRAAIVLGLLSNRRGLEPGIRATCYQQEKSLGIALAALRKSEEGGK
jgi:hypothetical protein